MKFKKIPNKLLFGKDRFYYSSSHKKQHDAKKFYNKLKKKGFRCRIIHNKNRYHIYRRFKKGKGYYKKRKK